MGGGGRWEFLLSFIWFNSNLCYVCIRWKGLGGPWRRMEGCTEAGAAGRGVQTEVGTTGRVWLLQSRWRRVKWAQSAGIKRLECRRLKCFFSLPFFPLMRAFALDLSTTGDSGCRREPRVDARSSFQAAVVKANSELLPGSGPSEKSKCAFFMHFNTDIWTPQSVLSKVLNAVTDASFLYRHHTI